MTEILKPSNSTSELLKEVKRDSCEVCQKQVYALDKLAADDRIFHKTCLRCGHCKKILSLGNYAALNGVFYCKPHFKQLFALKGNYSDGFKASAAEAGKDISDTTTSTSFTPSFGTSTNFAAPLSTSPQLARATTVTGGSSSTITSRMNAFQKEASAPSSDGSHNNETIKRKDDALTTAKEHIVELTQQLATSEETFSKMSIAFNDLTQKFAQSTETCSKMSGAFNDLSQKLARVEESLKVAEKANEELIVSRSATNLVKDAEIERLTARVADSQLAFEDVTLQLQAKEAELDQIESDALQKIHGEMEKATCVEEN